MSVGVDCARDAAGAEDRWVVGVDVGGTKTMVALARLGAGIEERVTADTGAGAPAPSPAPALATIVAEHEFATREHGAIDDLTAVADEIAAFVARELEARGAAGLGARVAAVGCGFPEYVSPAGELTSHEVISWSVQPRLAMAEALTARSITVDTVAVESDVRLGALGEATFGAGRGLGSFLYVSLGTGLSSTFVVNGSPWPGARGEAIALGEWPAGGQWPAAGDWPSAEAIATPGTTPAAEAATNLEGFASGTAIARRYRAAGGERLTTRAIAEHAASGEALALSVLGSAGEALGNAVAMLVAVLDPAAVVVGGGLGTGEPVLWQAMASSYGARAAARPSRPPLVRATCGARAGLLGAIALAPSVGLSVSVDNR